MRRSCSRKHTHRHSHTLEERTSRSFSRARRTLGEPANERQSTSLEGEVTIVGPRWFYSPEDWRRRSGRMPQQPSVRARSNVATRRRFNYPCLHPSNNPLLILFVYFNWFSFFSIPPPSWPLGDFIFKYIFSLGRKKYKMKPNYYDFFSAKIK